MVNWLLRERLNPYEIEIDKYLKSKLFQFELPNSYSIENFDLEKFKLREKKSLSVGFAPGHPPSI